MGRVPESSALERKRPDGNLRAQNLTDAERMLLKVIKSKTDMGIWKGDMKKGISNKTLPDRVINKSLKLKQLIKKVQCFHNQGDSACNEYPKVCTDDCSIQRITETVRLLVLDNEIVEVKSTGIGNFMKIPMGTTCYKCTNKAAVSKVGAMASIPCGVCPRIQECTPDGIISPNTCLLSEMVGLLINRSAVTCKLPPSRLTV